MSLQNGKSLIINSPGASSGNVFVKSIELNESPYKKYHITHDLITSGVTLDFEMSAE
ncbi:glycoside hydrolase domain-containing protein [Zobellia nedashkovskayae]